MGIEFFKYCWFSKILLKKEILQVNVLTANIGHSSFCVNPK